MTRLALRTCRAAGAFLPYATLGVGTARLAEPVVLPNFDATALSLSYGVGVDYALSDNTMIGAELTHHEFEEFPLPNTDLSLNTLSLSATFRF